MVVRLFPAIQRSRLGLDQSCCAVITNQRALVRDKAELEIESDRSRLIGKIFNNPATAHTSMLWLRTGSLVGDRDYCRVTSHFHRFLLN